MIFPTHSKVALRLDYSVSVTYTCRSPFAVPYAHPAPRLAVVTFRNVCIKTPQHTGSNSVFHLL